MGGRPHRSRLNYEWTDEGLSRLQTAITRFSRRAFYITDYDLPRFGKNGLITIFWNKESGLYMMHPEVLDAFKTMMKAAGLIPTSYDSDD